MSVEWTASNIENAQDYGIIEFQSNKGEFHSFHVLQTEDKSRIVFGGACNAGFLESGYLPLEDGESTNTAIEELLADLEVYYNDGKEYTSRIVCNERM